MSKINNGAILSAIEKISNTSGRNDKESLLRDAFKQVAGLKEFILYTLDPNINYYLKVLPPQPPHIGNSLFQPNPLNIIEACSLIVENVASRKYTGSDAKAYINGIMQRLDETGITLLGKVIKRDLRAGLGIKTINKAYGDVLIYVPPYMRCSGFSRKTLSKLKLPIISQKKMDGRFINIKVPVDVNKPVTALSRTGEDNSHFISPEVSDFLHGVVQGYDDDIVLMGEALALDDNQEPMPRELGNGYLNGNDVDSKRVAFYFWDCVTATEFSDEVSNRPYTERFEEVKVICNAATLSSISAIVCIESVVCESVDDIVQHFKTMRMQGEEGTVIKGFDCIWKDGVSPHQIKLKVVFECDLLITGFNEGTVGKQYEGSLGTITMESSDGLLKVNVGNGMSRELREEIWFNQDKYIYMIASIRANDITKTSKASSGDVFEYSLFLPRLDKFRTDKTEADDLNRVEQQVAEFINALKLLES